MRPANLARALLVNSKGEVLVLRRDAADDVNPGRVDFPGGGVDPDESYTTAIAREVREETGLEVPEGDFRLAYAFTVDDQKYHAIITRLLFVAHVSATDVRLSHEHDAYWWRAPEELQDAFASTSWASAVDFVLKHNLLG